jgi:DNA-binding NarL/FixJ family response regulator
MIVGDEDAHTGGTLDEVSAHAITRFGEGAESSADTGALVVAAAPGVRAGIRALLEQAGFAVVAEAGDAAAAALLAIRARPDICVVHGGAGDDGVATLALVKSRAPATAAVLLVEHADAEELIDALRAGASGYVLEGIGPAGIARALQAVRRGEPAIPRELLGALADEFRARGLRRRVQVPGRPAVELTRRQSEVLELLRRGLSTSEIADRLQISSVTVRRHLGLAIDKLAAKDRAAALRALEQAEAEV